MNLFNGERSSTLENQINNKNNEINALKTRNKLIEDRVNQDFANLSNIDYTKKDTLRMELNIADKKLENKIAQKDNEIHSLEAQLKSSLKYKEEASLTKYELDKSLQKREYFEGKVDESIDKCDNERRKILELTKKYEHERHDLSQKLDEINNKLKETYKE